jgi:polyphosphate glucokinase
MLFSNKHIDMALKTKYVLGVDFGGSGIKGAIVNTKTGKFEDARFRIPTPIPATPDMVAETIKQIQNHFSWKGAIGVGFPAVVQNGIALTASNIDKSWIGTNAERLFFQYTGCPVKVINDADAAGIAEMKYGAGYKNKGVVILVTVGTGIGTVAYTMGKLLPNTELGHLILPNGIEAERYASDAVRQKEGLSWEEWGTRFNEYLLYLEKLFSPDLFIIGGGVSKSDDKYFPSFTVKSKVVPAQLLNNAGIVGAAIAAKNAFKEKD